MSERKTEVTVQFWQICTQAFGLRNKLKVEPINCAVSSVSRTVRTGLSRLSSSECLITHDYAARKKLREL